MDFFVVGLFVSFSSVLTSIIDINWNSFGNIFQNLIILYNSLFTPLVECNNDGFFRKLKKFPSFFLTQHCVVFYREKVKACFWLKWLLRNIDMARQLFKRSGSVILNSVLGFRNCPMIYIQPDVVYVHQQ